MPDMPIEAGLSEVSTSSVPPTGPGALGAKVTGTLIVSPLWRDAGSPVDGVPTEKWVESELEIDSTVTFLVAVNLSVCVFVPPTVVVG